MIRSMLQLTVASLSFIRLLKAQSETGQAYKGRRATDMGYALLSVILAGSQKVMPVLLTYVICR